MIEFHRIWIDRCASPVGPRPEPEGALLHAQAFDSIDCRIVYALATLLVEQRWRRRLARIEKLVDLTPGQVGPRQVVEPARRQVDAVPAPR